MIANFFYDLGILPTKESGLENDPCLVQGLEMMEVGKFQVELIEPKLDALQLSSMPGIISNVETMQNYNPNDKVYNVNMSAIEIQFNKTLKEYSNAYQLLSEDLLKKNKACKLQLKENSLKTTQKTTPINCNVISVNQDLLKKLNALNDKLLILAEALGKETDNMIITDIKLKHNLMNERNKLNNYIKHLNNTKSTMSSHNINSITISGQNNSTQLHLQSLKLKYLVWIIITILVLLIVILSLNGDIDNKLSITISAMFSLIIFYIALNYVYNLM